MEGITISEVQLLNSCFRLEKENNQLRELLRWRKWPEEKPEKDGDYLCADSGRIFVAGFADGSWLENYGTDELLAEVQYWRPIGPLPGEGGE